MNPSPAGTHPRRAALLLLAALAAAPGSLGAFGKNKVVAHGDRWRVTPTEHFEIHHTDESGPIVPLAARYLELAYADVTRLLELRVPGRTSFFLHVDHNRFEENNVADVGEGTGGVTEAFKNRFVVFNDGTQLWLRHVIAHEFAHVAEFEALYGGFWKSARLLKSPLYPLWYMEGLAEYVTGDLDDVVEDMYLRDAATSGRLYSLYQLHGFSHLKPHEVTLGYKQGAAALRFLAEEYGAENVGASLKLLRERFEVGSIVGDLTSQDFRDFDRRYREHLTDRFAAETESLREPEDYGVRLAPSDVLPSFDTHPALSPDGRFVAYVTDRGGANEVAVHDLKTGAVLRLAGRQWAKVENVHASGRAVTFSPDGRWLAFAGEKEQRDYLYLYDLRRRRLRRVRTPFEQVRSPVFHPTEPRLAVVGMAGGLNDLYEVGPRGKLLRRLTHSFEDEADPAYSPDGRRLAYSRETLVPGPPDGRPERDLAALDLTTLSTAALTALPGREYAPAFTPDGRGLLFTGEADGVPNLYHLDLSAGTARRLTRMMGGAFTPSVSSDGAFAVYSAYRRGSQAVYRADSSLWGASPLSRSTATLVFDGQPSRELSFSGGMIASASFGAANAAPSDGPAPSASADVSSAPTPRGAKGGEASPAGYYENDRTLLGPRSPYRFRASTDLFFPLFFYSSTDGLFLAAFWQASEHLGNHQLQSTLQYSSGSDFLDYDVQYTYRRFRPQFFVRAGGLNYFRDISRAELRRESDQTAGVAYPLDRFHRIETVAATVYREDSFEKFPQFDREERENLAAVSFVRDTTTGRYLAVTDGDRFRATYQVARPVLGGDRDYDSHTFEYHRFLPTGREGTVAFRGQTGVSAGPSPQLFRLGGVDRVRGYSRNADENKAQKYVLGNLEWRVPLRFTNISTWFLFPDFYLKAVYATLFTDAGYDWSRSSDLNRLRATDVRHSVGAGLRFPVFIIQTYLVTASVDVAKRTDADAWVWYFSLGPEF
jgi:Tol biopolymer transport system component